jgi:hypothetical protein
MFHSTVPEFSPRLGVYYRMRSKGVANIAMITKIAEIENLTTEGTDRKKQHLSPQIYADQDL